MEGSCSLNSCSYSTDCAGCVTYADTLLDVQHVSLAYGDKLILRDVTVQVKDVNRRCHVQGQVIGFLGPSGRGKCLAKGTPVLMADGTIKRVEDIRRFDQLMGPDSKPRIVLGLGYGRGPLYDVIPVKGVPYRVNGDHILALHLTKSKKSRWGNIEISVNDYLTKSNTFKARAKGYRTGVNFEPQSVPLDPYFLGLWLGDGSSKNAEITTADKEIVEHLTNWAISHGNEMSTYDNDPGKCPRYNIHASWDRNRSIKTKLRQLGVLNNKHIPLSYKSNDSAVRMSLLAGIIDSDGCIGSNCWSITQKNEVLADDIVYLARSLGLAAYKSPCEKTAQTGIRGKYYRISISGHLDKIPVKLARRKAKPRRQIKDALRTGITIKSAGYGEYFGFELTGDGLFLLGDFTVTHNTRLFRIISGLEAPTSGGVFINSTHDPVKAGMVGVVAQNYPLFKHRTIYQNLEIAASRKYPKAEVKDRVYAMLKRFGLTDRASFYPAQLSGGQRQRIAIIQQLLCSEHFILMDEPFSGLDLMMIEEVSKVITEVSCLDTLNTIIVISHDVTSTAAVSDHLWLLGYDRDEKGNVIPGARIQEDYDMVEMGLCWQDQIQTRPEFVEFVRTVKERFRSL